MTSLKFLSPLNIFGGSTDRVSYLGSLNLCSWRSSSSISVAELVFSHLFSCVRSLHISNREMPLDGDKDFKKLKKFLTKDMRMSHVYQPVMIRNLLKNKGKADSSKIAKDLLASLVRQQPRRYTLQQSPTEGSPGILRRVFPRQTKQQ